MITVTLAGLAAFAAVATLSGWLARQGAGRIETSVAPSLVSVQQLSASIAEANAGATAAFLSQTAGEEDRSSRLLYLEALERASAQTETLAGLAGTDEASHDDLQALSVALGEYRGDVEAARTANALGATTPDARLRDALGRSEGEMAESVAAVAAQNQQRFDDNEQAGLLWGIVAVIGGIALTAFLLNLHASVARRSRRRLNLGLTGAVVLMILTTATLGLALAARTVNLSNAESGGYDAIVETAAFQTDLYTVQTQNGLDLLQGTQEASTTTSDLQRLGEQADLIAASADSNREQAVAQQLEARRQRYGDALLEVSANAEAGLTGGAIAAYRDDGLQAFNGLNTTLETVVAENREQFIDGVDAAAAVTRWLPLLNIVLPLAAALSAAVGLQARLREYS